MDIISFREYCLSLPLVEETTPFDDVNLVYKVEGKMFALVSLDSPTLFFVKCDPDRAVSLRDRYSQVEPAFHFNKRHWNQIHFEGELSERELEAEIRHSYMLVAKLNVVPKLRREALLELIDSVGIKDDAELF